MKLRKNKNKNFFVAKKLEEAATKFAFMTFSEEKTDLGPQPEIKLGSSLPKCDKIANKRPISWKMPLSCSH